jgi:hypothetical protein
MIQNYYLKYFILILCVEKVHVFNYCMENDDIVNGKRFTQVSKIYLSANFLSIFFIVYFELRLFNKILRILLITRKGEMGYSNTLFASFMSL